ncbi:unnamed protein product, partial [Brenthis ino]
MDSPTNNHNNAKECRKKQKQFSLRRIRLSLKYRPDIYKLIINMRQCIRKKNALLKSLKHKLKIEINKTLTSCTQTNTYMIDKKTVDVNIQSKTDSYTQTVELEATHSSNQTSIQDAKDLKSTPWNIQSNGDNEKSIAEQVKEVAQSALQETGMVYVESAGMYYDYKTGYYYNSELGLYYHTDTGCYYYYSDDKKTFVFHSYPDKNAEYESLKAHEKRKAKKNKKVAKDDIENLTKQFTQENEDESKPKKRKTSKENVRKMESEDPSNEEKTDTKSVETEIDGDEEKKSEALKEELEDGECSDTASESDNESTSTASDDESVAKHHPPCMRVIVRETNLPKLKVGSLYLITKDGGTLGREGDQHTIIIRDHNVSRAHLEMKYDMDRRVYVAVDLGSRNGTILNGTRMSESQERSSPMEVVHGSTIQVGETKLLCHVHAGNDTCGHCEPGLIMEGEEKEKIAYTRTCSVQKQHQLELARLKNKYAPQPLAIEETAYNDRARARRRDVGSSHHAEKTQSSDINTFIAEENKGFKLLEKMGWSKGEGLGKEGQGDTEPIPIISNDGKAGLGSTSQPVAVKSKKSLGPATLRLAARTKMLQPPAKAFQQPIEEDSE